MRLINTQTLAIEHFIAQEPKYAILSHTWTGEEVTFEEFRQHEAYEKNGYRKIRDFIKKVQKCYPHLSHVWVDTCCIDKRSSAETEEAINSMFRWYEQAEVCFAYFEDVPANTNESGPHPNFWSSRWFFRGWTLQELLAPRNVVCYACDWSYIGTRHSLAGPINQITSIKKHYLCADYASESQSQNRLTLIKRASAAEKFSWASGRETTRKEDIGYCLLGLLGVNMSLQYGEGDKAFIRLQEVFFERKADPTIFAWNWLPEEQLNERASIRTSWEEFPASKGAQNNSSLWDTVMMLLGRCHPWVQPTKTELVEQIPPLGILARSPEYFRNCQDVIPRNDKVQFSVYNGRVLITLPTSDDKHPHVLLPCRSINDPQSVVSMPLVNWGADHFYRAGGPWRFVHHDACFRWPQRQLVLSGMGPENEEPELTPVNQESMSISLDPGISIVEVFPPEYQKPQNMVVWDAFLRGTESKNLFAVLLAAEGTNAQLAVIISTCGLNQATSTILRVLSPPTLRYYTTSIDEPGPSQLENLVRYDEQPENRAPVTIGLSIEISRESIFGTSRFQMVVKPANQGYGLGLRLSQITYRRIAARIRGRVGQAISRTGGRIHKTSDRLGAICIGLFLLIEVAIQLFLVSLPLILLLDGLIPDPASFSLVHIPALTQWKTADELFDTLLDPIVVFADWTYLAYRILPIMSYHVPQFSGFLRRYKLFLSLVTASFLVRFLDYRMFNDNWPQLVPITAMVLSRRPFLYYLRTRSEKCAKSYFETTFVLDTQFLIGRFVTRAAGLWFDDSRLNRLTISMVLLYSFERPVRVLYKYPKTGMLVGSCILYLSLVFGSNITAQSSDACQVTYLGPRSGPEIPLGALLYGYRGQCPFSENSVGEVTLVPTE